MTMNLTDKMSIVYLQTQVGHKKYEKIYMYLKNPLISLPKKQPITNLG